MTVDFYIIRDLFQKRIRGPILCFTLSQLGYFYVHTPNDFGLRVEIGDCDTVMSLL